MYHKKHNRYSEKDTYGKYEENRFSDGKHFNQKHKGVERKSRNNAKQDLRKELYM